MSFFLLLSSWDYYLPPSCKIGSDETILKCCSFQYFNNIEKQNVNFFILVTVSKITAFSFSLWSGFYDCHNFFFSLLNLIQHLHFCPKIHFRRLCNSHTQFFKFCFQFYHVFHLCCQLIDTLLHLSPYKCSCFTIQLVF